MIGKIHHHAHVVLDHEHRQAPFGARIQDKARHILGLFAVHPRHRLVEHQDAWLHGQGPRQLHPLAQTIGQRGHRRMPDMIDLEEIDDALLDLGAQRFFFAARPAQVEQGIEDIGAQVGMAPQLDVVQHRHAAKQRNVLEAARQAQARAPGRRQSRDIPALEMDRALRGPIKTRDGIEQRGFAGAIGADDGGDRAGPDREAHVRQRLDPAKGERHPLNLQ